MLVPHSNSYPSHVVAQAEKTLYWNDSAQMWVETVEDATHYSRYGAKDQAAHLSAMLPHLTLIIRPA